MREPHRILIRTCYGPVMVARRQVSVEFNETVEETSRPSSGGRRFIGTAPAVEPFAIEVQRRDHLTIVRPRGELDVATVGTLRAALDVAIADTLRPARDGFESAARLLVDLRRLSFIDSSGVHLLVALDQRAQRDGFQLTLVAPAPPIDRAIMLCGVDQVLPFAVPDEIVDAEPGGSGIADHRRKASRDGS